VTGRDAPGSHARDEPGIPGTATTRPIQAALVAALAFADFAGVPLIVVLLAPEGVTAPFVAASTILGLSVLVGIGGSGGGAGVARAADRVTFRGALAVAATAAVGAAGGVVAQGLLPEHFRIVRVSRSDAVDAGKGVRHLSAHDPDRLCQFEAGVLSPTEPNATRLRPLKARYGNLARQVARAPAIPADTTTGGQRSMTAPRALPLAEDRPRMRSKDVVADIGRPWSASRPCLSGPSSAVPSPVPSRCADRRRRGAIPGASSRRFAWPPCAGRIALRPAERMADRASVRTVV
jgi:hypothetical protein